MCGRGGGRQAATSIPVQPGIWISSRIRSGCSAAAISMACMPVSASPAISTSGCDGQHLAQAGAGGRLIIDDQHAHHEPLRQLGGRLNGTVQQVPACHRAFSQDNRAGIAIVAAQAFGHIAQAVRFGAGIAARNRAGKPGPLSQHFDAQPLLFESGSQRHRAAALPRRRRRA